MGWVRQTKKNPDHPCPDKCFRWAFFPNNVSKGDLFRCDNCKKLWRVGLACNYCDYYGEVRPHNGSHMVGTAWRDSTWLQQLLYRKR